MCPKTCFLKSAGPWELLGKVGSVDMQGWSITENDF